MDKAFPVMPFSLLPPKACFNLASLFFGPASFLLWFYPLISEDLLRAGYETDQYTYAAACFANAFFNSFVTLLLACGIGYAAGRDFILIGILLAAILFAATFSTCMVFPQLVAGRKQREIDAALIPAVRQLLIQVRSGVPLFNALVSVSSGHRAASDEFEKVVRKLNSGVPEAEAFSEASAYSPSLKFSKVSWQVSNALKTGSDLGAALQSTLFELEAERVEQIKRYAQELSPLTMIYMIAAIIVPSLGVTLLIVVGSLLSFPMPREVLILVFFLMAGFQFFFLNFVSSRRPQV